MSLLLYSDLGQTDFLTLTDVAEHKTPNYISIFIPVRLKQTLTAADVIDQNNIQYGTDLGDISFVLFKTTQETIVLHNSLWSTFTLHLQHGKPRSSRGSRLGNGPWWFHRKAQESSCVLFLNEGGKVNQKYQTNQIAHIFEVFSLVKPQKCCLNTYKEALISPFLCSSVFVTSVWVTKL